MGTSLDPEFEKLKMGEWGKIITQERLHLYENYLKQPSFLDDRDGIDWTQCQEGAVLRKSHIKSLSDPQKRKLPLIHPFDQKDPEKLLKPASCLLRLGCHYRNKKGEGFLGPDNPTLIIPKHGISIVTTFEWLNIPTFLIARWNLRVHRVYDGLVWVGGPQVDPGYQGFLFCPIYNLSDRDQKLTYGRRLFTIDFSLTVPSDEKEKWEPREPRSTFTFWGLDSQKIESGPEKDFETIQKEISDYKNKIDGDIDKHKKGIQKFQDWIFVAIAIIIAVLAIISTFGLSTLNWSNINGKGTALVIVSLAFSILALLIVIFRTRKNK
jgi:deoxycytidine triphosphate deaminase